MEDLLPKDNVLVPSVPSSLDDIENMKFDLTPDTAPGRLIITAHGDKGAGKTTAGFLITTGRMGGLPAGKTLAISFDNKTKVIKDQLFPNDDITVHDGKKYYREDPAIVTRSGMITYKYVAKLIDSYKQNPPDWIIFDGFTIMSMIFEMAMRYKHGLQPTQGIANLNVWKDRGRYVQDIHNLAARVAKYGVMYITYSDKNEVVENGTTVTKEDVPKYIDIVMQETDVVLHATKAKGKEGDLFYLRVASTKYKQYMAADGKTRLPIIEGTTLSQGRTFNVTGLQDKKPAVPIVKTVSPSTSVEVKPEVPPVVNVAQAKAAETTVPPVVTSVQTTAIPEVPKPLTTTVPVVKPVETTTKQQNKFEVPDLMNL